MHEMLSGNATFQLLKNLGLCDEDSVRPYHPRVRDRGDIAALVCQRSGVIFLSRSDHMAISHYQQKDDERDKAAVSGGTVPARAPDDAQRRTEQFAHLIRGRRWLDVGTGWGEVLELLGQSADCAIGVEPQHSARQHACDRGLDVRGSIDDLGDEQFDVITLFHVLEHIIDPVAFLSALRGRLAPGGLLLVEVPHARDALLSLYECAPFRAFTLWSEHLVLHTRQSLSAVLAAAGYSCTAIQGTQRYPLSNHLYWLRHGQPGGHNIWSMLDGDALGASYQAALSGLDCTDTLVAFAGPARP